MCDALASNQAAINLGKGSIIVLRAFAAIEMRTVAAQRAAMA